MLSSYFHLTDEREGVPRFCRDFVFVELRKNSEMLQCDFMNVKLSHMLMDVILISLSSECPESLKQGSPPESSEI